MNIHEVINNPMGTIIYRQSEPRYLWRIGKIILERQVGDGSWIGMSMRIDDLRGDDWMVKEE